VYFSTRLPLLANYFKSKYWCFQFIGYICDILEAF